MDSATTLSTTALTPSMLADEDPALDDLLTLGRRASRMRRQLHPENVVTYANTATIACAMNEEGRPDVAATIAHVHAVVERGATGITLLPDATDRMAQTSFDQTVQMIRDIRSAFPSLWMEALPAHTLAAVITDPAALIEKLRAAGLDSIAPGDYALEAPGMLEVHRAAHRAGMRTRATLPILPGESAAERSRKLDALVALQAETGGFISVAITAPSTRARHLSDELTAVEFLTALATARLALPSILHVESSWPAQGLKLLQIALRFGADDAGSVHLDRGLAAPDPDTPTEEDLRRIIRDAGYMPVERTADYSCCFVA